MNNVSLLLLLSLTAASAAAADFEETRELSMATRGIDTISVDNGSGYVEIVGVEGLDQILVTATLVLEDTNPEDAERVIERDLILTLEEDSDTAILKAFFERRGLFNFKSNGLVNLDIRVPSRLHLNLDDGSGSTKIENVRGDLNIHDGSGSLELMNVGGEVFVDDGSGSILARGVGGDLSINDGSGSIRVQDVAGSVTIDDGSGSIDVQNIESDLVIVDDGSGSLDYSGIEGDVHVDS